MTVYLQASNNNRAHTVLELFKNAECQFGLPTRVRIDLGVENVLVARYMAQQRPTVQNCVLRGKSCHNQRIERLWVDVWKGVTNVYRDLFLLMETDGELEVENPMQMWALHFVFIPRLNWSLTEFRQQWNHHGLSTENSRSPSNLFVTGVMAAANGSSQAIRELFESDMLDVAVAGDGDEVLGLEVPLDEEGAANEVRAHHPLSAAWLERIQDEIDPLEQKEDVLYGQCLYQKVMRLLQV